MSGTSLDGLDIVLCELSNAKGKWTYHLIKCETVTYSKKWRNELKGALLLSGKDLLRLNRHYGAWVAQQVNHFLSDVDKKPDLIASHGHTLFHEPSVGFNFQLGDGNIIAANTGITTVSDFRSLDICLGGQGAPLVPIGDEMLFAEYSACVNLGGFANVSAQIDQERKAWDICPLNFVINRLMEKVDLPMDKDGRFGAEGIVINELLNRLNALDFYSWNGPKSLAQEWVDENVWPIIEEYEHEALKNIVRTCYEHFSEIIATDLNRRITSGKVLFTGGGVYNAFFINLLKTKLNCEVIIPDDRLVNYKEALVFALLGLLRMRGEANCLMNITGAGSNSSSGSINYIM